jgi:hypothetical protein
MAAKKDTSAFDFIVKMMEKDPSVEYQAVRAAAEKRGLAKSIYPIMYGRAQNLLGLAKRKKKAKKAGRRAAGVARKTAPTRGRPRRGSGPGIQPLEAVIEAMKNDQRERERYRKALERISEILGDTLS